MNDTANYQKKPTGRPMGENHDLTYDPKVDLVNYVRDYAKEKPDVAALWCLGIGFVLGWKLKPW